MSAGWTGNTNQISIGRRDRRTSAKNISLAKRSQEISKDKQLTIWLWENEANFGELRAGAAKAIEILGGAIGARNWVAGTLAKK